MDETVDTILTFLLVAAIYTCCMIAMKHAVYMPSQDRVTRLVLDRIPAEDADHVVRNMDLVSDHHTISTISDNASPRPPPSW
jgi:hypothetical protein